jgi:transcriptional regulator with XRE-family HTH domain
LLFDSLEAMSEAWNQETAKRFFARACPLLFGLGAIAYWSLIAARHSPALRREIEGITQCVLAVGDGRLRIAKAEGRPLGIEGSVYRHGLENGRPVLAAAPAAARLGAALRALRSSRRLSQRDLAHLAGVSPSAISQAERGRGGLSLETLLDLAGKLNITLDDLLRGDVSSGYRLARRDDPCGEEKDRPVPLLDDPRVGLRVYVVRLSRGAAATPDFAHKGVEVVTVAAGLVQVLLESGRPVLRRGEALIADTTAVAGWRNLSDREATVFWVLHDA